MGETFIGDRAQVRSIDVDRWGKKMNVYTYARTRIGTDASVSSVSVAVSGLELCVSNSVPEIGEGSSCTSHAIDIAPESTRRDITS